MATPEKTHGYTIKYDSTVVGDIDAGIANATNCYIKIPKDTPVSPAFYNWFMANATKIPKLSTVLNDIVGLILQQPQIQVLDRITGLSVISKK